MVRVIFPCGSYLVYFPVLAVGCRQVPAGPGPPRSRHHREARAGAAHPAGRGSQGALLHAPYAGFWILSCALVSAD